MPIRFIDKTGQLGQISTALTHAVSALIGTHTAPASRTGTIASQLGSHVSAFSGAFQANADRIGTIGATLDAHATTIVGGAPQEQAASSGVRFNPGHYLWIDTGSGGGGLSGWLNQIASISGETSMTGVQFAADWSDVETNTRGTYDWTLLDQIVNAASSINKKVMLYVKFQYFGTSPTSPNGRFPTWMATVQGGSAGYTAWDGVNPASPPGNLILVANLWNATTMLAYTQLGQAIANRYKNNMAVEMFGIGETAIANLPGSGYSTSSWITQLKGWMTAMRAAWPNTAVRVQTNYLDTDAQMQDLIAHAYSLKIACGGPDNYSRTYMSNPIFTGFTGGINYRDALPWVSESQYPASSSGGPDATSSQIYTHNISGALSAGGSTNPNYFVWFRNNSTLNGAHTWSGETLPFIRSISGACNTTVPGIYLGHQYFISPTGSNSNDGRATTRPWTLSALASFGSTYAGKSVGLMNGTYTVTGSGQILINISTASGTSTAPTTIKAMNERAAVITTNNGGSYPSNAPGCPALLVLNSNWVVIDGLKITDLSGHGIALQAASNIVVRNCEISNILTSRNSGQADSNCGGIYFLTQSIVKDTLLVENCKFSDIYNANTTLIGNTSNGVGDLFGARNVTVRNCTFTNIGTAMYWKGQSGNVTFNNNFVYNCASGLQSFSTVGNPPGNPASTIVYGNIFVVNWMGGAPSSNNNGVAASTCQFYNNTIVLKTIDAQTEGGDFGWIVFQGSGSAQTLHWYNNAISLDAALGLGPGLMRFPSSDSSGSCVSALTKFASGISDYNRYTRFSLRNNPTGQSYDDAAGLTSWRSASGKDAATSIGTLSLSNIAGSTVAAFAPNGGALVNGGRAGGVSTGALINAGHTGSGTNWGCDF